VYTPAQTELIGRAACCATTGATTGAETNAAADQPTTAIAMLMFNLGSSISAADSADLST
jgi:hypothetical protein